MSGLPYRPFLLPILAAFAWAGPAHARETTGTVQVVVEVDTSCVLSATPLDFGTAPILSSAIDSTSTISVKCSPGTAYILGIDNGQNYNGSRRMVSDAGAFPFFRYVGYQVYRDPARSQVWGSGPGQGVTGIAAGTGAVDLTAYGRVPAAVILPTEYRDVLTVILDF